MAEKRLTALYRYPVKSLRGQGFAQLAVGPRGFVGDRQWMVVDAEGRFLSQRQQARMSLVDVEIDGDGELWLHAEGMAPLSPRVNGAERRRVTVWSDDVVGERVDPATDAWLSAFLDTSCQLVRFPDDIVRPVDPAFAAAQDQVGFADGFPFLLISEASLTDLNARLQQPVDMIRFRPNLVVSGCEPFEEDSWRRIRIGPIEFRVAKPCSRCIIPTIDPATGERGREPLATLMTYRRRDNKVYFGQNLVHDHQAVLEQGMAVEVLA
ncbi:MAG: MOSC domain-containing protein [Gammaproteobacteria bacterium]|nr:MOSC domain-containing protein [Gammaproteobacteria bacterium]